jgi:hypothetical protein
LYQRSNDKHNGKFVWDRVQPENDDDRAIFWNKFTLKWCVTDKEGRYKLGLEGNKDGFICSEKAFYDETWFNSNWGSSVVAHVVGPTETSP